MVGIASGGTWPPAMCTEPQNKDPLVTLDQTQFSQPRLLGPVTGLLQTRTAAMLCVTLFQDATWVDVLLKQCFKKQLGQPPMKLAESSAQPVYRPLHAGHIHAGP